MVKVGVLAAALLVIILAVSVGILLVGGSAKLTSLFYREKKNTSDEERSDKNDQGPHGPVGGSGHGAAWV